MLFRSRIEFYEDKERVTLLEHLKGRFTIINEGKIKPSKVEGCKSELQFLEVVENNEVH